MLHHNDNNSFNGIEGARKKAIGVVKGVSDFELVYQGGVLFMEGKMPGEKQLPEQVEFMNMVIDRGHEYVIFYSFEEFQRLIINKLTWNIGK